MAKVRAHVDLPGPISAVEALFYDVGRRSSWVDGYASTSGVDGPWPDVGARVRWSSPPGGRGMVGETVDAYRSREGQVCFVEDERLSGTQTVSFSLVDGETVRVTVALAWKLKAGQGVPFVVDLVFVRRAMADSLRQTLRRLRVERLSDLDDAR